MVAKKMELDYRMQPSVDVSRSIGANMDLERKVNQVKSCRSGIAHRVAK
jgi:hypothetical protein